MNDAESGRPLKIMITDDDRHVVDILATKCRQLGFIVETATNGIKAILQATTFEPDILVVDVQMPETGGFSIASHIVELSGKSIGVIAISGQFSATETERWEELGATCVTKGTNFWVKFAGALMDLCPGLTDLLNQMQNFDSQVRKRSTILLVDDDRLARDFLASRFDRLGLEVITTSTGANAFKLAKRERPAVIVTDYFMPNGDAEYLLRRLKSAPETKFIPVVVHTGRELSDEVKTRLQRTTLGLPGAAHIVRKSPDAQKLLDTLRSYCGFAMQ